MGNKAIVFQGEIYAIQKAAEALLIYEDCDPITFFIDSQAAILALVGHTFTSRTVKECFDVICKLANTHTVTLSWVKAHAGHELNELADEQAKLGTLVEEVTSIPVPWCILCLLYTSDAADE